MIKKFLFFLKTLFLALMIFFVSYAFLGIVQWDPWIGNWGSFSRFLAAIMMLISLFWFIGKIQTKKKVYSMMDAENFLNEVFEHKSTEEIKEWLKRHLKCIDEKSKFNSEK